MIEEISIDKNLNGQFLWTIPANNSAVVNITLSDFQNTSHIKIYQRVRTNSDSFSDNWTLIQVAGKYSIKNITAIAIHPFLGNSDFVQYKFIEYNGEQQLSEKLSEEIPINRTGRCSVEAPIFHDYGIVGDNWDFENLQKKDWYTELDTEWLYIITDNKKFISNNSIRIITSDNNDNGKYEKYYSFTTTEASGDCYNVIYRNRLSVKSGTHIIANQDDNKLFSLPTVVEIDNICTYIPEPTNFISGIQPVIAKGYVHRMEVPAFTDTIYGLTPGYRVLGYLDGATDPVTLYEGSSNIATFKIPDCKTLNIAYQHYYIENGKTSEMTDKNTVSMKVETVKPVRLDSLKMGITVVDPDTKYKGNPMKWVVVDNDNPLYPKDSVTVWSKEITNREFSASNISDYPRSNINQWLNSDKPGGQWFESQFEGDIPPSSYADEDGFLTNLSTLFKTLVLDTDVVSNGYERRNEQLVEVPKTCVSKFFIPGGQDTGQIKRDIETYGRRLKIYSERISTISFSHSFTLRDVKSSSNSPTLCTAVCIGAIRINGASQITQPVKINKNQRNVGSIMIATNLRADTLISNIPNADGSYNIIGVETPIPPTTFFPTDAESGQEITSKSCTDMQNFDFKYSISDVNMDKVCVNEFFDVVNSQSSKLIERTLIRTHYPENGKDVTVNIPNNLLAQVPTVDGDKKYFLTIVTNDGSSDIVTKKLYLFKESGGMASVFTSKMDTGFDISEITKFALFSTESPNAIDDSKVDIHISQKPFNGIGDNDDQIDISENYRNKTPYIFSSPVKSFYYRVIIGRKDMNVENDLKLDKMTIEVK